MSERPGYDFRGRQISPATLADWRHDARPTNHDSARIAVLNRRITALLDALYEAEASLAQAWADGYNHAKVEMLSATIGERVECATCSGRGVWMDEPCGDCGGTATTVNKGCDCPDCRTGDDRWCCRRCHALATET